MPPRKSPATGGNLRRKAVPEHVLSIIRAPVMSVLPIARARGARAGRLSTLAEACGGDARA
eukprot:6725667-Pyramimonas_sp.AAC.1